MPPDFEHNMYAWVDTILAILKSNDPHANLMYFLLDFEQEVYNRALVDAMKSISELSHTDQGQTLGKLMSLRLNSMPMIQEPPKLRENVIPLKPRR